MGNNSTRLMLGQPVQGVCPPKNKVFFKCSFSDNDQKDVLVRLQIKSGAFSGIYVAQDVKFPDKDERVVFESHDFCKCSNPLCDHVYPECFQKDGKICSICMEHEAGARLEWFAHSDNMGGLANDDSDNEDEQDSRARNHANSSISLRIGKSHFQQHKNQGDYFITVCGRDNGVANVFEIECCTIVAHDASDAAKVDEVATRMKRNSEMPKSERRLVQNQIIHGNASTPTVFQPSSNMGNVRTGSNDKNIINVKVNNATDVGGGVDGDEDNVSVGPIDDEDNQYHSENTDASNARNKNVAPVNIGQIRGGNGKKSNAPPANNLNIVNTNIGQIRGVNKNQSGAVNNSTAHANINIGRDDRSDKRNVAPVNMGHIRGGNNH